MFGSEGGYTDNPKDPGNWTGGKRGVGVCKGTKFGIAANTYPHLDIKNLTIEEAARIYASDYWTPLGADGMGTGVDLVAFDCAVNSGVGRAKKFYVSSISDDPIETIETYCDKRRSFMRGLGTFQTFGKGWLARVARVQATGTTWALAAGGLPPKAVRASLLDMANDHQGEAEKSQDKGNAIGGGSTVIGGGTAWNLHDVSPTTWVLFGIVVVIAIGAAVYFLHRHRAKQHLADALKAAAVKV